MGTRASWVQMVVATVLVMLLPAAVVWALSARGVITSLWFGVAISAVLALAFSSAGSAYWRRHASGDVLFSDLLLWGWLRRRRMEGRLGRADDLFKDAAAADPERKAALLGELSTALDAKDTYLDGHSRRVARYAEMTARKLDLPDEQVERLKAAALIHDIGKLRIPEEILRKPSRLSHDEYEVVKQHCAAGGEIAEGLGEPALAAVVRAHHERFDGSGYPEGLAGDQIPLEARIISVADTFDAITASRAYKQGSLHAHALDVIAEEAGRQLDPAAAHAFISCYSDRRGAALWAGLASIPRQVAQRLSIAPGEIVGVATGALTSALVVAAGAMASTVLPESSDQSQSNPPVQAVVVTAQPEPSSPTPRSTPTATVSAGSRGAGPVTTPPPSSAPPQSTSSPVGPEPQPAAGSEPEPEPPPWPPAPLPAFPTPEAAATPEARAPVPTPEAPIPEPTLGPPSPTPTPTATPTRTPTATPTRSPAPTPSRTPTPKPTRTPTPKPTRTPPPRPPHTADDCKNGGWQDLGYPNQGQCIADADKP